MKLNPLQYEIEKARAWRLFSFLERKHRKA